MSTAKCLNVLTLFSQNINVNLRKVIELKVSSFR